MKKRIALLLSVLMLAVFAVSCVGDVSETSSAGSSSGTVSNTSSAPDKSTEPDESSAAGSESGGDSAAEGSKTLVVCFSATGNTKRLAQYAAEYIGADFYEITPETPYTSADLNYNDPDSRVCREHSDPSSRPAISGNIDTAKYETVLIAYPIWWGQAPNIVYTFVESHDLGGKTLAAMCTSASSPLGSSADNLKSAAGSENWLESRRFSSSAPESDVAAWLDDLGL